MKTKTIRDRAAAWFWRGGKGDAWHKDFQGQWSAFCEAVFAGYVAGYIAGKRSRDD